MNAKPQLQYSPEEARRVLEVTEAFNRLIATADFKLVHKEITEVQAARLVALLGDSEIRKQPDRIINIQETLQAVGIYQDILRDFRLRGELAKQSLMSDEELQAYIDAEESSIEA